MKGLAAGWLAGLLLVGCASGPLPRDSEEPEDDEAPVWCPAEPPLPPVAATPLAPLPLSPGDRLRVWVHEGADFSGIFEVDQDGRLHLPYLPPLPARGHLPEEIARMLASALVEAELIRPELIRVSITPSQWAPVTVDVSGAVFSPGRVGINARPAEQQNQAPVPRAGQAAPQRSLTQALANAGGARPEADLRRVEVIRDGQSRGFDLRPLFRGGGMDACALIAGDRVHVPARDCLQAEFIRPSAITPPGFRVFLSNLSIPADSNAKAAVGNESSRLPYGTRLLQGVISANCVGGTQTTNARRHVVHVSRHWQTQEPMARQTPLSDLLDQPENPRLNPYLMPGDGIACYDSGVTNLRDIARTFTDILTPLTLLRLLQ